MSTKKQVIWGLVSVGIMLALSLWCNSQDDAYQEERAQKCKLTPEKCAFQNAYGYIQCSDAIEEAAKYQYEWMTHQSNRFSKYVWKEGTANRQILAHGDKVRFQNGFGAFRRVEYVCIFDLDTEVAEAVVREL